MFSYANLYANLYASAKSGLIKTPLFAKRLYANLYANCCHSEARFVTFRVHS